jgi:hypothetical protein
MEWITEARNEELKSGGDNLFSPFVAAGWNPDENYNKRPAQWLGLMKALGMLGADFYYTSYFGSHNSGDDIEEKSTGRCPNDPCYADSQPLYTNNGTTYVGCNNTRTGNGISILNSTNYRLANYMWQAVVPTYAQAITSRYEDILVTGKVLKSSNSFSTTTNNTPIYSYNFAATLCNNQPTDCFVAARKSNTAEKFALTATLQPKEDVTNNCGLYYAPTNKDFETCATISLPTAAGSVQLTLNARRQGSTYIYDRTNTSDILCYQLDGWHENNHPLYWCRKQFILESELNDSGNLNLKTDKNGQTGEDYRNAYTYETAGTVSYNIETNEFVSGNPTEDYHIFVRCKKNVSTTPTIQVSMLNTNTSALISIINTGGSAANAVTLSIYNNTWQWVYVGRVTLSKEQKYALQKQSSATANSIHIDKWLISESNTTPTAATQYPTCP